MHDPTAARAADEGLAPLAPRVEALDGRRIGLYHNAKPAAEPVSAVLTEALSARYPAASFEPFHVPARDAEGLASIGEWASEMDACLAVIGDCGGCTRAVARATNAIEAAGTPAVGLVATPFGRSFVASARDQGRALRHQPVSLRSETTDLDEIRSAVDEALLDGIEAALTSPLTDEERGGGA